MVHLRLSFGVHGRLTEWLGSGLQNHLRRFESATDLNQSRGTECPGIFCFRPKLAYQTEEGKQKISMPKKGAGIG
jgi:hypothetical protein